MLRYLCLLLLTCHDEKFCGRVDDIDFLEDGRRVVCQRLLPKMIHNKLESAIWTKGRPDDFCEFMDSVDVTEDSCMRIRGKVIMQDLPSSAPWSDLYPSYLSD